jgi:hypothetical protein
MAATRVFRVGIGMCPLISPPTDLGEAVLLVSVAINGILFLEASPGAAGYFIKFDKIRPLSSFVEACKRSLRGEGQAGKGGWVENRVEDGTDRGGGPIQRLRDDEGVGNAGLTWLNR